MKNIYRFFVSALVLFAFTVACNPPEINEPDNPSNPEQTGYTITASIVQTRVSYDDSKDGEKLEQKWEENDILFGFYGGEISNEIIFKVSSVNGGVATLDPVDGWEDGLGKAADGTEVNLVYTGANINSIGEFDFSEGLFVDMSSQTIGRIPACMHSQAELDVDGNERSLHFQFINDCAIIEISGLSGIKEQVTGSPTISSIEVTNLLLKGTYSYQIDEDSGKGELVFVGNKNTISSHSITLGDGWSVDKDGFIKNTAGNLLLIAAAPNSDAKEINVTAAISGMDPCTYSYGEKSLQAGNCYVINAAPVVAKVEQGSSSQVFATVYEAFCYAEELNQKNGDITVTLLKDCGLGRHFDPGVDIDPLSVTIWYKVSLDLNGHVLTLSGDYQEDRNEVTTYDKSEYFNVCSEYDDYETRGELTINDSSPYQTGAIISESNTHLILNSGDVIINGGTVKHNADWCAVRNYTGATLTVKHGTLHSEEYCPIGNEGDVTIYGGTISSTDGNAINNWDPGTVNIYGGNISSDEANAIYSDGTINIGSAEEIVEPHDEKIKISSTGENNNGLFSAINILKGTLNMYEGEVTGDDGAMMLCGSEESETPKGSNVWKIVSSNNPLINIYGGYIHVDEDGAVPIYVIGGAQCVISGGVISNNATSGVNPALITYSGTPHVNSESADGTSLTIKWAANGDEDNNNGQPVIYSASSSVNSGQESISYQNVPLCYTSGNQRANYSVIEISGGYICSSTDCFFEQDVEENNDLWQKGTIGGFYANKPSIYHDHNESTNLSTSSYGGVSATEATGKSITIPYINKTISTLYLVEKVSE